MSIAHHFSFSSTFDRTYTNTDPIPYLTQFDWVAMFTPHPDDFTEKLMAWVGNRRPSGLPEGLLNAHIHADRCVVGDDINVETVETVNLVDIKGGRGGSEERDSAVYDTDREKTDALSNNRHSEYDDAGYCRVSYRGERDGLKSLRVADVFDTMFDVVTAMNVFGEFEY